MPTPIVSQNVKNDSKKKTLGVGLLGAGLGAGIGAGLGAYGMRLHDKKEIENLHNQINAMQKELEKERNNDIVHQIGQGLSHIKDTVMDKVHQIGQELPDIKDSILNKVHSFSSYLKDKLFNHKELPKEEKEILDNQLKQTKIEDVSKEMMKKIDLSKIKDPNESLGIDPTYYDDGEVWM